MFSGSIIVLLLLSLFSAGTSSQSSTALPPAPASTAVAPSPSQSAQPSQSVFPSSPSTAPTSASAAATPTTEPTVKPTCAVLTFIFRFAWDERLANTSSNEYKVVALLMPLIFRSLYNDSQKYEHVNVSGVKLTKSKYTMVGARINLCVVVKSNDGAFIEDVFKAQVKTGTIYGNMVVRSDSAEFDPLGVTFKDWKAKDGECDNCEGAGGEFVIEGTCEVKTSSCKGLKDNKMTKDCVIYCPSSAVAITVSSLILAVGIYLSLSVQ